MCGIPRCTCIKLYIVIVYHARQILFSTFWTRHIKIIDWHEYNIGQWWGGQFDKSNQRSHKTGVFDLPVLTRAAGPSYFPSGFLPSFLSSDSLPRPIKILPVCQPGLRDARLAITAGSWSEAISCFCKDMLTNFLTGCHGWCVAVTVWYSPIADLLCATIAVLLDRNASTLNCNGDIFTFFLRSCSRCLRCQMYDSMYCSCGASTYFDHVWHFSYRSDAWRYTYRAD